MSRLHNYNEVNNVPNNITIPPCSPNNYLTNSTYLQNPNRKLPYRCRGFFFFDKSDVVACIHFLLDINDFPFCFYTDMHAHIFNMQRMI